MDGKKDNIDPRCERSEVSLLHHTPPFQFQWLSLFFGFFPPIVPIMKFPNNDNNDEDEIKKRKKKVDIWIALFPLPYLFYFHFYKI